jgi:hypothetical protein
MQVEKMMTAATQTAVAEWGVAVVQKLWYRWIERSRAVILVPDT